MSLPVLFRPAARREFDEAADWYEQHRAGWGAKFVAAVQDVIDRAAANPRRYAKASGETREGLVRGFPYCVYYCEQGGQLRPRRLPLLARSFHLEGAFLTHAALIES